MGIFAALLLAFSAGQSVAAEAEATITAQDTATYVGEEACAGCHVTENKNFGHTLHAKVFRKNPKNQMEKQVCEACHGPGSNHVANPTDKKALISFTKGWGTPLAKMNEKCLTCHDGGNRINWQGSMHQSKKLACSDCHNPMAKFSNNGLLKKGSITETCQTCHQQQRAEFRRKSHMPVPEGKMTCTDCHNPHGSGNPRLLKGETVNDTCYTCHAEKRGPFLFEHAPVRENCLNCHLPHGSVNDKLLKMSRPNLCTTCHGGAGAMGTTFRHPLTAGPDSRLGGRSCQNCHAQIHGSNTAGGSARRLRQ
ncbi:MAG TPA: DmsE family decaheme c-type cytochrome [Gallionella sp.]|nr:DmsE family decaheme c-type cytochrome [Gallionella sp.]